MSSPDPMDKPPQGSDDPLAGLDPADLLRQGAAEDTLGSGAASFVPPSLDELAGIFPRFDILGLIGKGGMGAVYKVRQKELDRIVALKILPPAVGQTPAFMHRFTREARALAKLNHPGIVTLHEYGQEDGLYFFLMEFVDGVNLRQLMLAERIQPREAMAIVPQICDALQFAHDQGIVHRDIKPENILIDRLGRVKVADFGIAKVVAGGEAEEGGTMPPPSAATLAGNVIGTPQYMAPEQIDRPADVDHRADIYALGVVFYQMLTGELPGKELQAPSRKVRIDVRLDEIVLQALEKNPELRFQQARVMKTRVEEASGDSGPRNSGAWEMDYRSKTTWFGLPLLHVAFGPDTVTGKERVAKGIVAIGAKACGVLAFGGQAYGVFAFGGIAAGLFAFGGLALGVVSWGGMAVALGLALGGLALGWAAIGGTSVGYYSYGSATYGVHQLGLKAGDEAAKEFFMPWAADLMGSMGVMLVLFMAVVFLVSFGVPMWISRKAGNPGDGAPSVKPAGPPRHRSVAILMIGAPLILAGLIYLPALISKKSPEATAVPMENRKDSGRVKPAVTVNVFGEARQPGTVPVRGEGSLLDVMAAAGGWTGKADLRKISVLRQGATRVEVHDLRAILAGKAVNPRLEDRAVVTIPSRIF